MYNLSILFLISFATTYFVIPRIIKFALKRNIVDSIDNRKDSREPIARIGGIGIVSGICLSLIFIRYKGLIDIRNFHLDIFILLTLSFFILGFLDDLLKLSPWSRLFFQILFSSIAWSNNFRIDSIDLTYLNFSENYFDLPQIISFFITVIWITGIVNSINWIDGLDGLAVGIALFAIFGLVLVNFKLQNFELLYILFPMAASCLAFLKYNYHPAKILMGDGGSYSLGFLIALISIASVSRRIEGIDVINNVVAIYFPILLLFVPIFDMSYVMFLRISKGNSPFYPDRNHIHHRLMKTGMSNQATLLVIYSFAALGAILTALLV